MYGPSAGDLFAYLLGYQEQITVIIEIAIYMYY